jgi:predicted PurR-regulated permease PerM
MHEALDQKPREGRPPPDRPNGWPFLREAADQKKVMTWLLVLGVLYTLYFAKNLLFPVFIALYLTMFLKPLVRGLQRLWIPPVIGAAVIVALVLSIFFSAFVWLSTPAGEWLDRAPGIIQETKYKLYEFKQRVEKARKTTEQLQKMTTGDAGKNEKVVVEGPSLTLQVIGHARSFGLTALIVMVLLYLFLAWGGAFLNQFAAALGDKIAQRKMLRDIRREITRYLVTISIINAALGIITAGVTALFGLPNPLLWGVVAGVLNFIPYLGGAVTTVILTIVSFVTFEGWVDILLPPLVFVIINGLEGFVVTPIIIGKRLSLNPIGIFLSLLFWGWIWGVAGVFLATPILVTLLISANKLTQLPQIAPKSSNNSKIVRRSPSPPLG